MVTTCLLALLLYWGQSSLGRSPILVLHILYANGLRATGPSTLTGALTTNHMAFRTKIILAAGRQGGVHSLKLADKLELASALAGGPSHVDRSVRGGRFQPSVSDPNVNLLASTHNEALTAMASEGAGSYDVGPERSSCGTRAGRVISAGGPTWEPSMRRGSTGGAAYGLDAPVVSQATSRRVRRSSVEEAAALIAITKNFSTRGALMDPGRGPYAHRSAGGTAAAAGGLAGSSSLHSSSRGSGGYRAGPIFSHGVSLWPRRVTGKEHNLGGHTCCLGGAMTAEPPRPIAQAVASSGRVRKHI